MNTTFPGYLLTVRELTACTKSPIVNLIHAVQREYSAFMNDISPHLALFAMNDVAESLMAKAARRLSSDPRFFAENPVQREQIMQLRIIQELTLFLHARACTELEDKHIRACYSKLTSQRLSAPAYTVE